MACHDYCIINVMPVKTRSLLGLGLKYCIKKPSPTNRIDKMIHSFRNNPRCLAFFKDIPQEEPEGTTYIKEFYIKSDWEAPKAGAEVEQCITNFE